MCCIFTCIGWLVDLIQRVWTFAMSCCISSAICCVMMTSSLSGIALGYNYSLAEYIDLKETNVSVYLKRGVFDDEIADDMDWRRAGHLPVAGHLNEDNLITAAQGDPNEIPLRSGRRLEDSVFDSHDNNKFEGSLMKLTAKPVDAPITRVTYTPDHSMAEVVDQQSNDLDRMKAIQGVLNQRRFNVMAMTSSTDGRRMLSNQRGPEISRDAIPPPPPDLPRHKPIAEIISGRRFNPYDPDLYRFLNPARTAVPDTNIGAAIHWTTPHPFKTTKQPIFLYNEIYPVTQPTRPNPVPLNIGPISPPTPRSGRRGFTSGRREFTGPAVLVFTEDRKAETKDKDDEAEGMKSGDETDRLSQKMRQELSRQKSEDYPQKGDEDYEVDAKGLPVRKKRHIEYTSLFSTETKISPALLDKFISTLMQ